jgi:hypothetical protein
VQRHGTTEPRGCERNGSLLFFFAKEQKHYFGDSLMKTISLLRLLLDCVGEPHWQTAKNLKTTGGSLSKLAAGITCKHKSLELAANYLSQRLGVRLESGLLTEELDAKQLVATAIWSRAQRQKAETV